MYIGDVLRYLQVKNTEYSQFVNFLKNSEYDYIDIVFIETFRKKIRVMNDTIRHYEKVL